MDGPLLLAVGGSLDQSHNLADALRYRRWRTRSWSTSLYVGLNQLAKRVCTTEAGTFLNYTTTVVNGTDSRLAARYGGISVDGHRTASLCFAAGRNLNKKERKSEPDVVELGKIHCIASGFLPSNFFSANGSSQVLPDASRTALTVLSVVVIPAIINRSSAPSRAATLPARVLGWSCYRAFAPSARFKVAATERNDSSRVRAPRRGPTTAFHLHHARRSLPITCQSNATFRRLRRPKGLGLGLAVDFHSD